MRVRKMVLRGNKGCQSKVSQFTSVAQWGGFARSVPKGEKKKKKKRASLCQLANYRIWKTGTGTVSVNFDSGGLSGTHRHRRRPRVLLYLPLKSLR